QYGERRRLGVCTTPPASGAPKYVSRCGAWFHIKVATRSPRRRPARSSAPASERARSITGPHAVRCNARSGCRETISTSAKYRAGRSARIDTVRGKSIMVPRIGTPPRRGAVYRGVAARFEVPRQSVRQPQYGPANAPPIMQPFVPLVALDQRHVDRLAHQQVAERVRMDMVAELESRRHDV